MSQPPLIEPEYVKIMREQLHLLERILEEIARRDREIGEDYPFVTAVLRDADLVKIRWNFDEQQADPVHHNFNTNGLKDELSRLLRSQGKFCAATPWINTADREPPRDGTVILAEFARKDFPLVVFWDRGLDGRWMIANQGFSAIVGIDPIRWAEIRS